MKILTTTIARWLFALPFLVFGIVHFISGNQMVGIVPITGGIFWIYLVGVAHILAAISFITGKLTRLAGILLGIMLIIFALSIHLPALLSGNQMELSQVLKDLALAGGAFGFAGSIEK